MQDRLPGIVGSQYGPVERSMSGNDDAGQMSAWLVLSSLGFYQVCPGCGGRNEYVLGLPLFSHVEVSLPSTSSSTVDCDTLPEGSSRGNCKTTTMDDEIILIIDAIRNNDSTTDRYIQLVTWNGCTYDCAFFPHEMLAAGGHLTVYLGPEPMKTWGGDGYKCMDRYVYRSDDVDISKMSDKIPIC